MSVVDDIGGRGEAIFYVRLTDFCGRDRPYFRPRFLGEKSQTHDYLVELIDAGKSQPFFFIQVKTTKQGYTKKTSLPRLKVKVSKEGIRRMALYPAPTYLVGIDEMNESAFIVAVHGKMNKALSSLPTKYPLDSSNLKLLWNEVKDFWNSRDMTQTTSAFSS